MKAVGIIAEYNPFHNGHAYQIRQAKEMTGADYCIIVMSGDFVQRGAPAIVDKYERAQMALSGGADLVIELPVLWATASAEAFAHAGVAALEKAGCVDTLCFGVECLDLQLLDETVSILVNEPEPYRIALSGQLREGDNFPAARAKAVTAYTGKETADSLLRTPNNILAVEYMKALRMRSSDLNPLPILRSQDNYHETALTGSCSSATAIRKILENTKNVDELKHAVPPYSYQRLLQLCESQQLLRPNDFSGLLAYVILKKDPAALSSYGDCGSQLAHRIKNCFAQYQDYEQFCAVCKSRDVTYTRLARVFTHMLLDITQSDYKIGKKIDYIPYLRILGFRREAAALMKELKKKASVPLITKLSNASSDLSEDAMTLLNRDIFAAELYERTLSMKTHQQYRSEFTRCAIR